MLTGLPSFLLLACLGGGLCCPALAEDLPLTPIPELLATPRVEAAKRPAIKVRGTISLIGEGLASPAKNPASLASFCLEENETGIWVSVSTALREGVWQGNREIFLTLHEGMEIEMEGVLDAGAFAPIFLPARLSVIGEKPLPPAKAVSLFRLMSGAADVQRVVVMGVVQSFVEENDSRWLVKVETGLGHFLARLPRTPAFDPARLLDAEVKMTGLAAVSRNWRSEFVCPRLIISHEQDVEILRIPPPDAFAALKLPLSALDAYSPKGRPRHRRRIEGTLTYYVPGSFLFLQEGNCAVRVESSSPLVLTPGDRVEATGFIDTRRNVAGLSGALIRRTGTAVAPAAVPINMSEISGIFALMKAGRTARLPGCDGLLVSVRGKLLSLQGPAADGLQRLELDCGDAITTAFLKGPTGALLPGSQLQASGIATLQYAPGGQTANFTEPLRLDLLLRDVSDIKVLSAPSWWTTTRIWSALLGVLALAAVILTWAVLLRRTVARQTRLLAQEMRGRRDAAVEFQAALRERSRLAANLHDTVLQTMTGIGYQIEACEAESLPEAERPANYLETPAAWSSAARKTCGTPSGPCAPCHSTSATSPMPSAALPGKSALATPWKSWWNARRPCLPWLILSRAICCSSFRKPPTMPSNTPSLPKSGSASPPWTPASVSGSPCMMMAAVFSPAPSPALRKATSAWKACGSGPSAWMAPLKSPATPAPGPASRWRSHSGPLTTTWQNLPVPHEPCFTLQIP